MIDLMVVDKYDECCFRIKKEFSDSQVLTMQANPPGDSHLPCSLQYSPPSNPLHAKSDLG